jgi:hypothetical protein
MNTQKYNTKEYVDRYAIIIVNRIIDDLSEEDFFLNCLDNNIWREVNDLCVSQMFLKNNGISKTDVAIRCSELIQDIYTVYRETGEFNDTTENRSIIYSFSNHKDRHSYSDSKEQLSAKIDTVCFAITSNQVDTLLDDILDRFENYKRPFSRPNLVKRRILHRIWSPVQDIEKHNKQLAEA